MIRRYLAGAALAAIAISTAAQAEDDAAAAEAESSIIITGQRMAGNAGTKTDTPLTEIPQPITIVADDVYLAQGAISVADTLRYVAGVQANNYGPDSRVDGSFIRGVDPLQFRDGMRDIFSYYASIRADPYNFSQVEVVRGPASVLFGSGTIGGLVNLVSKTPQFETGGEVALRYGSFDRIEALADVTGTILPGLAGRVVARVRDAGTQTRFVPDDRVLLAPSLLWQPGPDTEITLIGMYQEDDGGSTAQFLPLVGTLLPNPNGRLPFDTFVGKPGWDRYDGRLLQGTAIVDHEFGENLRLSLKARYIDSDLTYFTHYPDNYSNPTNPFVLLDPATGQPVLDPVTGVPLPDPEQRTIGLYSDGSLARMEVFSTDNNLQWTFNTGSVIEHLLLAGVDYSWSRVRKTGGYGFEYIDIYDIDYDALSDYGGGLPEPFAPFEDIEQEQLGFYIQDQVRILDRVSVVLGARRDQVTTDSFGERAIDAGATSFRAGIIGDIVDGVSPFLSYTESFEPITGADSNGDPFVPKRGSQWEGGVKLHPDAATLITATAYHIEETNRPVDDPTTPDPFDQIQIGSATIEGFELEATRILPGNLEIIAAYSYNDARDDDSDRRLENVPRHNASLWATKSFDLGNAVGLRLGGGVRYSSANVSYGPAFPDGIRTPDYTLVDALAEVSWRQWRFAVNATNLFGKDYYAACLARGDCFNGAGRNVFGTVTYRF